MPMILHRNDLDKVRLGLAKCRSCGTYYDPTYGPCPQCSRKYNLATIAFAVTVLLFLLFWLPLEARAQVMPPPCIVGSGGEVLCNHVWLPVVRK